MPNPPFRVPIPTGIGIELVRGLYLLPDPSAQPDGKVLTVASGLGVWATGGGSSGGSAFSAVASGSVVAGDLLVEGDSAGRFKIAPLVSYNGLPYATPARRIRGVALNSASDGQALSVQPFGARVTLNVDPNEVALTAPLGALVSASNFTAGKVFLEQQVDGKLVTTAGCVGVLLTAHQAGQATVDVLFVQIPLLPGASLNGQQNGGVTPWVLDPEYGTVVPIQGAGTISAMVVQLPDNSGGAYSGLSWHIFDADGTAGAAGNQTITIQVVGGDTLDTTLATAVINSARGGRRVVGFTDSNFVSGWRLLPQ